MTPQVTIALTYAIVLGGIVVYTLLLRRRLRRAEAVTRAEPAERAPSALTAS